MANNKLTNPVGVLIIICVVVIFATLIGQYGNYLASSSDAALSENSINYINKLNGNSSVVGFNNSLINDEEMPDILSENDTSSNLFDYALDFIFGKKVASILSRTAYLSVSIPEFIIIDLFSFQKNDWLWLIEIFNWIWRALLFIMIYWVVRNR